MLTSARSESEIQKIREDTDVLIKDYILNPGTLHIGEAYVFFSKNALFLKKFGFDRIARTKSIDDIKNAWEKSKVVDLSELGKLTKWNRDRIIPGKRYVIWGAGFSGAFFADAILKSDAKLVFSIDNDEGKDGKIFYGANTHLPKFLSGKDEKYDYLLIAHYSRFEEIRGQALEMGVDAKKIIMPYEV